MENNPGKLRRYLSILSGFLAMMVYLTKVAGMQISGGVFIPYIASYLYDQDQSVSLSVIFSVHSMALSTDIVGVCNIYIVLSSLLKRYISCRLILLFGALLISITTAVSTFMSSSLAFALVFALPIGIGSGFLATGSIWPCLELFPSRKGLVSGFLYSGLSLGPAVWSGILFFTVNPSNISPSIPVEIGDDTEYLFPSEVAQKVPLGFIVIAIVSIAIGVFGAIFIYEDKAETQQVSYKGLGTAVKSSDFICIFVTTICGLCWWTNFLGIYRSYGLMGIPEDRTMNIVTAVAILCGIFGRFVFSAILDVKGYRFTIGVIFAANIVLCFFMIWGNSNVYVFGGLTCGIFFVCNGFIPCKVATIGNIFGTQLGPILLSIISIYMVVAGVSFILLFEVINHSGFFCYWIILLSFLVLGMISVIKFKFNYQREELCT